MMMVMRGRTDGSREVGLLSWSKSSLQSPPFPGNPGELLLVVAQAEMDRRSPKGEDGLRPDGISSLMMMRMTPAP